MSKIYWIWSLLMLFAACSCVTVFQQYKTDEEESVRSMMDSTVQIHVEIAGTLLLGTDKVEIPIKEGWVGSGVVYEKTSGISGPVISKILTANHVLNFVPGQMMESDVGPVHIDAVLMTVTTRHGQTCSLKPLTMGSTDNNDVATAVVYCDAGKIAHIATKVPPAGAKIYVSGHPLGFPVAIITTGYVSGWANGYLVISASSAGGNSGGPIFYEDEVIGLLVRNIPEYSTISFSVPLRAVIERIEQTP